MLLKNLGVKILQLLLLPVSNIRLMKIKIIYILAYLGLRIIKFLLKRDSLKVLHSGQAKLNIKEPPITNRDAKWINFLTSRIPILDRNNKVTSVVGISIDITDLKKINIGL